MVQSSVPWFDFSEQDRRLMIEVVSIFKDRDTRDDVGLSSVRKRIADLYSSSTSTLQARVPRLVDEEKVTQEFVDSVSIDPSPPKS